MTHYYFSVGKGYPFWAVLFFVPLIFGWSNKINMAKLTDKQKRFCEEYVHDWNATKAAIRAGYSERSARQIGEQNLSKIDIKACIDGIKRDLQKLAEFSALQAGKILIGIANDKNAKDADRINAVSKAIEFFGLKGYYDEPEQDNEESDQLPTVNIFRKRRDNDKE